MFPLPQTPPTQTPPGQQSEEDEPDSSSYAGMATALANAIKERRQHISDKSEAGGRGWMGRRKGGREDEERGIKGGWEGWMERREGGDGGWEGGRGEGGWEGGREGRESGWEGGMQVRRGGEGRGGGGDLGAKGAVYSSTLRGFV